MRTRKIKMYIGLRSERWITCNVLIPLATPGDMIERLAIACCKQLLAQMRVEHVFVGVLDVLPIEDEWQLFVNEGKPHGCAMPCTDVERCMQAAIDFFKCTDDQIAQLRNGAVVIVNVPDVGETTLRAGRVE